MLLLGAWPNTSMAGKLDSVRSEVSGSSSSSSSSGSSSSSSSDSSCCDWSSDDSSYSYGGGGGGVTFGASGGGGWGELEYRRYPYADGARTYLTEPTDGDEDELEEPSRPRSGMVWAEGAIQGEGLWRGAGGLRYDGRRISLDGDLSYYLELPANDALYLGTANLSLIPLKTERAILRFGAGVNTMIDGRVPGEGPREYALGWNLTSSLDLFPAWPIVLSGRVDATSHAGRDGGEDGDLRWLRAHADRQSGAGRPHRRPPFVAVGHRPQFPDFTLQQSRDFIVYGDDERGTPATRHPPARGHDPRGGGCSRNRVVRRRRIGRVDDHQSTSGPKPRVVRTPRWLTS